MKKQILPILTTMLVGATAVNAQITVTANDFKMPIAADSAHIFFDIAVSGVALPSTGANQLWDYAALPVVDSISFSYDESDKVTPFDLTTGMFMSQVDLGNYTVNDIQTYFNEADSGVFITGYHVKQQTINISGTDEIVIPEQDILSTGSNCIIPFDLTDATNNTYTSTEKMSYTLTYAPIFNNAPGEFKRDYNVNHEVIGWGKVILPKYNDTVEGLLLKSTIKTTDSIFLNGAPAPAPMLAGLNMTQGYITTDVSINIIAKDFNHPVMNFYTNETADTLVSLDAINSSYYIDQTPVDTNSITKINTTKINAYPNPASDVLNLELDAKGKLVAEVYNIEGRLVARQPVIDNKLNIASFKLGTYFVVVRNDENVLGTAKFIKD
jgi:hypothetical protein